MNKEIQAYQEVSQKVKLQKVWDLLKATPHSGQAPIVDCFDNNPEVNSYVVVLGRRAQPLTSNVLTPTGWTALADLEVGNVICDTLGGTQEVTELHPIIHDDVYEVTIGDRKIRCNAEHLFTIEDAHGKSRTLNVLHIQKYHVAGRKNCHRPGEETTEFKFKVLNPLPLYYAKQEVTIDPYVLGCILGDGSITHGCTIGLNDPEVLNDIINTLGYGRIYVPKDIRGERGYALVALGAVLNRPLKALGLMGTNSLTKFIPNEYIYNDVDTRINILRGLFDTDGSVAGNNSRNMALEYCTISPQLAEAVKEIVLSLGGNVTTSTKIGSYRDKEGKKVYCNLAYRLYIQVTGFNPFRLERKASKWIDRYRPLYNYIKDVRKLPTKEEQRCISVSSSNSLYVSDNFTVTHNSGKSFSTSVIVLRELLIPYSNTILLSPSYKNSSVMFLEVLKHVQTIKLPIKSINKNQFVLELENGAKFTSVTQTNYESALGNRLSLLVVDESASVQGLKTIIEEVLLPMFLDYGVKDNGILHARAVLLGTPKGVGSAFHSYFLKELKYTNWKSFTSPSSCNPLLPKVYLEQQKEILPDHVYRQELLAEWLSKGQGVFFAFDPEVNLYDPDTMTFDKDSQYICGIDWGHTDSTAKLLVYVDRQGNYFVHRAYQQAAKSTKEHVAAFRLLESTSLGTLEERYGDPSAAQTMLDLRSEYDYDVSKANNRVPQGIACLNDLMAIQGMDKKPKLLISNKLTELIRQIRSVTYKDSKSSTDPFEKDPEGTHWDLLAALRYAIYTHHRSSMSGIAVC